MISSSCRQAMRCCRGGGKGKTREEPWGGGLLRWGGGGGGKTRGVVWCACAPAGAPPATNDKVCWSSRWSWRRRSATSKRGDASDAHRGLMARLSLASVLCSRKVTVRAMEFHQAS